MKRPAAFAIALWLLRRFEALRLHAYKDQIGRWTIGYGATGPDVVEGTVWTELQAVADLGNRVEVLLEQLLEVLTVPVAEAHLAALISLAYNVGFEAVAKSHLPRLINDRKFADAADDFLSFDHADGKVLPDLQWRRHQERQVFLLASP